MKDQKIQQSLERCFGQKQVLAESIDSMFHENKFYRQWLVSVVTAQNLQTITSFLNIELSQYGKSGSKASLLLAAATAANPLDATWLAESEEAVVKKKLIAFHEQHDGRR